MNHSKPFPLTLHDLYVLHQALNEVCHGIEVPEFSTRMGASREEVLALMKRLGEAIDSRKTLS
jgi:hypothetical protein